MSRLFFAWLLPLLAISALLAPLSARDWVAEMADPHANFYEIRDAFEDYWKTRDTAVRGNGWKPFQRWAYFWEPRVFPSGEFPRPDASARALADYRRQFSPYVTRATGSNWTSLGPRSWVSITSNPGIGRINCVARDPLDPNVIYAGAPSGGFWKSSDGGASWITTTDDLPVLGVSAIAIHPADRNVIFIGTGDGDAGDTYSVGILKSTDAGQTWDPTGFTWDVTQARRITRLLIHPTQPEILLAGTNVGLFRSTDGGDTWNQMGSETIRDMHFRPGDPSTVFAAGTAFFRSTDTGESWSEIAIPYGGNVRRLEIAVTPADPGYVYVIAGERSSNGFLGLYRSTNGGQSFAVRSTTPNILNSTFDGSGTGGQAWYDLALAVSPTDRDVVYAGGISIWKSLDGGSTWDINAYWRFTDQRRPYVHADIHTLRFEGSDLYAGSDGGLFVTDDGGASWLDISAGMVTTQFYRIGGYAGDPGLLLGGTQDNGTNRWENEQWTHVVGADGMEASIDYSDPSIMYACIQNGGLRRSLNGGNGWTVISGSINEPGYWVTPHLIDPQRPEVLYAGYVNVWRSANRGNSWTRISDFSGTSLRSLAVAPSDHNTIFAGTPTAIYRTTDGGSVWTDVSGGLPGGASITNIAIDPLDARRVYVTFSGYVAGIKAALSDDGGDTWTNISGTLPNVPANCIIAQKGGGHPLYIGTDVGVFYRHDRLGDWIPFDRGLPNVIVRELEIHGQSGLLRAATYGRGLWESPLEPAGPVIVHEPLRSTEDETGPYRVTATIDTVSGALVGDSLRVVYGVGGSFAASSLLTPTGAPDRYEGWIPGLGSDVTIGYYLTALSVGGGRTREPHGAPAAAHAFYVGPDTVPPVLMHDPIDRADIGSLPAAVTASASDNIAVERVRVEYAINGVGRPGFALTMIDGRYRGIFPFTDADVAVGDRVTYTVTARDSSSRANETVSGPHEFPIVEVRAWRSSPAVDIPPGGGDGVSDTLRISGAGGVRIQDADLRFRATHENFGDLVVRLTLPGGSALTLMHRPGYPADPFGTRGEDPDIVLDDDAAVSVEDAPFGDGEIVTGRFRPDPDDLAALDGLMPDGDWILTVIDAKPAHTGRLLEWGLDVVVEGATGIADGPGQTAARFALHPNYPNPFNPATRVAFELGRAERARLTVYDVLGRRVRILVDARLPAGPHSVRWDGRDTNGRPVASGLYVCRLEAGTFVATRKMLLMK